jgi:hypothetical protein
VFLSAAPIAGAARRSDSTIHSTAQPHPDLLAPKDQPVGRADAFSTAVSTDISAVEHGKGR